MDCPTPPPGFEDFFGQLVDNRHPRLTRYPLKEVLFLVLIAQLCGCDKLTNIAVFGQEKLDWLRKYYAYANGIPSHDTLGRVLAQIDRRHFESLFVDWVSHFFSLPPSSFIQIDGKHISGSANGQDKIKKREHGGKYAQMILNVYADAAGITLAHHNFSDSMSEVKAALEVLDWLNIEGCCISADSNFCRSSIVEKIIAKKADYLLALKANAKSVYEAAVQLFEHKKLDCPSFETHDRAHGREEHRIYRSIKTDQLPDSVKTVFSAPYQLIQVKRHRHILRSGKRTTETHYYLTSLKDSLDQLASAVRRHWRIENELHYVLDVSFGEDASRVQQAHAASNLSLVRKIALNLLKTYPEKGAIKAKQLRCAISDQRRDEILNFMMR